MFRFFKRAQPVAAPEPLTPVDPSAAESIQPAPGPAEAALPEQAAATAADTPGPPEAAVDGGDKPAEPDFFDPALAFADAFEVVAAEKAAAEALRPKPVSLRDRLAASSESFRLKLGALFDRNPSLDEDLLDELETALITADVGVAATTDLIDGLRARMKKREFADADALYHALREQLLALI
ncbi:MAG: signal recognition particle receptor subunit alpha, partial [Xanthomonadales bacterium]|nr:signal recognition particle receptor subunit alpha [Xanthomonadales bacterium]